MENLSDESLMEMFQQGDESAFEKLLQRHQSGVYRFLLRFCANRDTAAELCQETWLRVVAARRKFERRSKFTTWLYTIARNLCIDQHRRSLKRRAVSLEAPENPGGENAMAPIDRIADPSQPTDEHLDESRRAQAVSEAIGSLPSKQREVLLMREEGLPFEEIARLVGAPLNTVKSRMRYALQKLRDELRLRGVEV